jgi:fido (protein-threonine AMPylation protein)
MNLIYPPGATPLDPNEIDGLIPNIRLQSELNAREEDNIIRCRRWALSSRNRRLRNDLLSVAGLKLLHQKMFDEVWKWAGSFRLTEKNIGRALYSGGSCSRLLRPWPETGIPGAEAFLQILV